MTEIIEHICGDFGVTVIYTLDDTYKSHVDFTVARITGIDCVENGVDYPRCYERAGAGSSEDTVFDPHDAEVFMHGGVKWDGCVNFEIGNDSCMLHACGRHDLELISQALVAIYERCGELMVARGVDVLDGEFKFSKPAAPAHEEKK